MNKTLAVLVLICILGMMPLSANASPTIVSQEVWPIEDWIVSTPYEQGMNESKLQFIVDIIDYYGLSINAFLVVRNGYLVFERYWDFFDNTTRSNIFSCTKSFTSTAIGLAIEQGYITNTSVKMLDFFQDRTIENMDNEKANITIDDLLTMRAGFEWNDDSSNANSNYNEMIQQDDWVQYVLDRPMIAAPGSVFEYNSGASHLLSAIVQNATGMTMESFMNVNLFNKIGITSDNWREDPMGISIGGNTLQLTGRDMARMGYLFLRGGEWNGEQIVSSSWVNTSTQAHSIVGAQTGYGYQWWTNEATNSYYAAGYMGQYIHVVPALDLVVVLKSTSGIAWDPTGEYVIASALEGPWIPQNETTIITSSSITSSSSTTSTSSSISSISSSTTLTTNTGIDFVLLSLVGTSFIIVVVVLVVIKKIR